MENVITLGKLIGLLFCSVPPLYFVFENSKNTRNDLARPVMGTILLVNICRSVGRYVCRVPKCVGGITCAHAQSHFWAVKTDL